MHKFSYSKEAKLLLCNYVDIYLLWFTASLNLLGFLHPEIEGWGQYNAMGIRRSSSSTSCTDACLRNINLPSIIPIMFVPFHVCQY